MVKNLKTSSFDLVTKSINESSANLINLFSLLFLIIRIYTPSLYKGVQIFQINNQADDIKVLQQQKIINNEVKTILQCIDDNSFRNSSLELSPNLDAQKKGSEITYFRRYTLASLLGLQAVDDDGNLAAKGLPHLLDNSEEFENSKAKLKAGKITLEGIKTHYKVSSFIENKLTKNN